MVLVVCVAALGLKDENTTQVEGGWGGETRDPKQEEGNERTTETMTGRKRRNSDGGGRGGAGA